MLDQLKIRFACGHWHKVIIVMRHYDEWDLMISKFGKIACHICLAAMEERSKRKEKEYVELLTNLSLREM